MNKKAVSPEMLVILLAFVIGAMILLLFGSALAGQLKEDADLETCRLSVLAQSQLKFVGKSVVSLDCPRRNLKIYENKVEINGKKTKKYEFNKLTENELNRIVAEELRFCWHKMAEGNRDVFEQSRIFGEDKTCLICTELEFDVSLGGKSFGGLTDYLKLHKIPKAGATYYDYLVKSQIENVPALVSGYIPWSQYSPWGYGTTQRPFEDKFDTNQKYIIYFLAFKPSWATEAIKAYTSAYYIGLGKEAKVTEECNILVN